MAVGAAGHPEDRLVHQQQRRGEVPAAGEGEQGAAKDHPGGENVIVLLCNRHVQRPDVQISPSHSNPLGVRMLLKC